VGRWGSGEVGEFQLTPYHPKTLKPQHPKTLTPKLRQP
jgi:hypothetical protein